MCRPEDRPLTERALFGSRLRIARERRKLTLAQIATQTKLSSTIIAALEDGTCARWPTGVYSRSYVRSYAELVGLDPAETVDEFAGLFPHLAFLSSEHAPRAETTCVVPRRATRAPVAPLRLFLEETPGPWWSRFLARVASWLNRVANGGGVRVLEGDNEPEWSPAARDEASPFAALQVDP
jgi:transcriptional regulator with XRE-family HTH domain